MIGLSVLSVLLTLFAPALAVGSNRNPDTCQCATSLSLGYYVIHPVRRSEIDTETGTVEAREYERSRMNRTKNL